MTVAARSGVRPRVVFFGSPAFAVPCLRAVAAETELVAVVSQPDRPAGRGQAPAAPAVKHAAEALGLPGLLVLQPEKIRTPETRAALAALDADLFVVVAYGRILPQTLLDLPRLGPFNVHASLLPKLRGAAPIQWSIIRGERETGVSIMRMEAGLDTGPVAAVRALQIADDDTTGTLSLKLADLGASLLVDTLPAIVDRTITLKPQDDAAATLAPLLAKVDGIVNFDQPARLVSAQARGVDPWPGAATTLGGESAEAVRATGRRRPLGGSHLGATAAWRDSRGDGRRAARLLRERRTADRVRRDPVSRQAPDAGRARPRSVTARNPARLVTDTKGRAKGPTKGPTTGPTKGPANGPATGGEPQSARGLARDVLARVERDGAYAGRALAAAFDRGRALSPEDRALATELVYGVLRRRSRLDRAIDALARTGTGNLDPAIQIALRTAAYQILFLDRIPAYAAVSEGGRGMQGDRRAGRGRFRERAPPEAGAHR